MALKEMIVFHEKYGDSYILFEEKQLADVLAAKFDSNFKDYPEMYEDIPNVKSLTVQQKAKIISD